MRDRNRPGGEIAAAFGAFHNALAGPARPVWLARRQDPWARANRVAWGEAWPA
ncbi:MAG: hypothetical protein AAF713_06385 [Pseudomonadota bacterium]